MQIDPSGEVSPEILKDGAQQDKGEHARMQYFVGAIAVGDMVKSTLGPKGLDKILQPMKMEGRPAGPNVVTNDGATILKSVWLNNPAAKILVDISMQQDKICGDGTTGVVVLASELLREAEILIEKKIHPQTICSGYRTATKIARKMLEKISVDHRNDFKQFEKDLINVAKTTLSSKLLRTEKAHFADLAVKAIMRVFEETKSLTLDNTNIKPKVDLSLIQIIKKPGAVLRESWLEEGFILEKQIGTGQPKSMSNCKVLVSNTPMDADKVKIYGAKVTVDSFSAVKAIEDAEREKMKEKVDKILKHGCNVFINRQLIYNYPEQLFNDAGIISIEHSDFDGMERLAACLGGDIISTFDNPETAVLGYCDKIDEIIIGEDKLIRFSGCKKKGACTIVLRGGSTHILDEAERSLHDALAILGETISDGFIVPGGGASEMAMAYAVEEAAKSVEGKEGFAVESFAKALRMLPTYILTNAGFDSADIICKLRAAHNRGQHTTGIDIEKSDIGDMIKLGVFESYKSKLSQICLAAEAAEMLIRVDNIIKCAPRQRSGM